MTESNFRALCAELLDCDDGAIFGTDLVARARAALAQPEPQGPTDEGLDELVQRLLARFHTGDTLEATWAMAAQWGADQELEACLANIHTMYGKDKADWLRAMRRPKLEGGSEN
jgi:hypothetical protein